MGLTSYKNRHFGTFTLLDNKLAWVDNEGGEGMLNLTEVRSVWLGEQSTGGTSSMGQASLIGVAGDTTLKTIPGKPPANLTSDIGLWAMKIRDADQLVTIYYNPTMKDDITEFTSFVRAAHKNIAETSPSASYIGGGLLNLLVFIFLSFILLVFGGGAAFLAKATGLNFLFLLGGMFTLTALALFTWGVRTSKPKTYDPRNIPNKLLPDA
ncbi:MAG: hypothetical protein JKY46_11175 [Robiginitomaculum sp.]|nr:hypothetical protein [Robiginitomaculum sp.]